MTPLALLLALGMVGDALPGPSRAPIELTMGSGVFYWSMAPFRAPSIDHALGTFAMAGVQDGKALVIEWDLAGNRELGRKTLAEDVKNATLASASGHLFVVTGGDVDQGATHVVLTELDGSLSIVEQHELGVGGTPSIAVNEKWIVVGYFEERAPIAESIRSQRYGFTTHHAMHVTAVGRVDGVIAGSKVLRGPHMLVAPADASHAMHAIAMRGDDAYLALPSAGEVTALVVRVPSFGVVTERTLDKLGAPGLADVRLRGDDLEVWTTSSEKRLFTTALTPRKSAADADVWNHALEHLSCDATMMAWTHRIALCQEADGTTSLYTR